MIPWNYNIYGIATADYLYYNDANPIGTLLNETTYGYFYDNNPLYSVNRDVKLEESIYLWHIGAGSSAGTNAAFCLSTGDTLELQTVYNQPSKVPLAMQLCNVDTRDFYSDPKARLCYDFLEYTWVNYYKSKLFIDINRTKFCVNPRIRCYNTSNNAKTTRTLTDIVSYINGDPEHRYVYLMYLDLYNGENVPRGTEMSYVPGEALLGNATPDILIDRPIPDNATAVKLDLQYLPLAEDNPQENWISDKQYSPFTQAIPHAWYDGNLSLVMPYCIGELLQNTVAQIRTGRKTAYYNSNRITGGFMHLSTKVQEFDDVSYQWQMHNIYEEGFIELENGFPLDTLTSSHHITTVSLLHIIDKKDAATMGEAVQRALKHEIAFYGFYFADSENEARNATLGTANTHIYLPEFINGTTTGNYFTGDQIPDVPYANSTSVGDGSFFYDPAEVEGNEGDFSTELQSGALSAGTVYYALSDQELKDLLRFLNTTYNPDETTLAEDFKGANPFEYITSVKYYPFCLPYAVAQQINVGPISTGVTGYIMPYTYGNSSYSFFDMGSFTFTPRYNNFLDYAGTQINLYLPWCGTIQLDPAMWIASAGEQPVTLHIYYSFDYVTGAVTAFLFRDTMLIDTADGQVGIDIPMSALATGSYQAQIAQAQIAYKQAATSRFTAWMGLIGSMIGTAAAAASGVGAPAVIGGLAGIASSVNSLQKTGYAEESASYTLDHTSPNVGSISAASPFNSAVFDQRPRILITRPQLQQLPNNWRESYAKSVGYACSIPTKLNNASIRGFTVVQAPRLEGIKKVIGSQTFTPTREELDLIRQALAEGIIL